VTGDVFSFWRLRIFRRSISLIYVGSDGELQVRFEVGWLLLMLTLQLVPSARCSSTLNVDRETLAVAWNIGHLPRDRTEGLSVSTGFTVLFVTAGVKPEQNRRARGVPGTTRVAGSLLQV
jgi:hypothetical protein